MQNFRNDQKLVSITPPAAISDNATLTCTATDTKGWRFLDIIVYEGATDIAMTTLKVRESDDNSTYTDVTGLVWGTSTNIDGGTSALPSATDDNLFQLAQIDLRGRKRYIQVSAVTGDGAAGTYITILGILRRAEVAPSSASEMGSNEVLRV